jgi:hypothetical protein
MTNLQMRQLFDGTYFIQYSHEGKSRDGSFPTYVSLIQWLEKQITKTDNKQEWRGI